MNLPNVMQRSLGADQAGVLTPKSDAGGDAAFQKSWDATAPQANAPDEEVTPADAAPDPDAAESEEAEDPDFLNYVSDQTVTRSRTQRCPEALQDNSGAPQQACAMVKTDSRPVGEQVKTPVPDSGSVSGLTTPTKQPLHHVQQIQAMEQVQVASVPTLAPASGVQSGRILAAKEAMSPTPQPGFASAKPEKLTLLMQNTTVSEGAQTGTTAATSDQIKLPNAVPPPQNVPASTINPPLQMSGMSEDDGDGQPNDLDALLPPVDARVGSSHATTAASPTIYRAQATQVAQQLAIALSTAENGATEIALNPEELGRVRLSLSANDGVISVSVIAERAETSELMRRNLDALAREFRELGYHDVQFSFGGDQGHASGQSQDNASPDLPDHEPDTVKHASPPTPASILVRTGLDLKL